jgi:hypothetical protein
MHDRAFLTTCQDAFEGGLGFLAGRHVVMVNEVQMSVTRPVSITDVEFEVRRDGQLLGRLKVGPGGLAWRPPFGRADKVAGWAEFADWMLRDRPATR